jgi:hypothetical protein
MLHDQLNVRNTDEIIVNRIKELMKEKNGWSMLEILKNIEQEYGADNKAFARKYILDYCNI